MADAKSHAGQPALSVARRMRRPTQLLSIMIARAERIEPDDGLRVLAQADFASTLASLLARKENAPATLGRARATLQSPAAAVRPLRAVSSIDRGSPAKAGAVARTGASRKATLRREFSLASNDVERAEAFEATPTVAGHTRTAAGAEPRPHSNPRDPAAQRAMIAAARDRLRATGESPIRETSPTIAGPDTGFSQSRVWADHSAPGSVVGMVSDRPAAGAVAADRASGISDLLSVDMQTDAGADEYAVGSSPRLDDAAANPPTASSKGGLPAGREPLPGASAPPLPASQYVPEPSRQRAEAGLVLDDDATELLEEAYRHGVDVTWR